MDHLSPRAAQARQWIQGWINMNNTILSHPYDPDRFPYGIINLGLAENWMIQNELSNFLKENFTIDPLYHLTYGQGPAASPPLRTGLARLFNKQFKAQPLVSEYDIIVASGVTSLIDSIAWTTCRDNEGLIIPMPLYNSFPTDMQLRSSARLLPSSFLWDGKVYSLDDVFNATAIRRSLEHTWNTTNTTIRGIMITNPHNPLGRCYSQEALTEIAHFCGEHKIHFISDEIYANSVFFNQKFPDATNFTSVLSLDLAHVIDPNLVHVMYGMSKDFGASGLRLAGLHSRNPNLTQAAIGVNLFAWPSYLAQDMWARILLDENTTRDFLELNAERLAKGYDTVTAWLDKNGFDYFRGGNAGLFVWAHLFPTPNINTTQFLDTCLKNGVNVGDGQKFFPEETETGWFRITFSYPDNMLLCGLKRLERALNQTREGVTPGPGDNILACYK